MKIFSFFSYKGGAGRSTLAYNIIPIIAKDFVKPTAKNPLVVVDMDIDSRGMTLLLDNPRGSLNINEENCVQYYLANRAVRRPYPGIKEHPDLGKLCPVGNAFGCEDNDSILLLPAMADMKIEDNSGSNYNSQKSLDLIMQSFTNCCKSMGVSGVFFDSAVGDQLTAKVSNALANVIICCMRPTKQFRDGTVDYFNKNMDSMNYGKDIVVVPNVVPTYPMTINNRSYPDEAIRQINNAFKPFLENTGSHNFHLDMLDPAEFGVPTLRRFMWREDILRNIDTLTDEERLVFERYKKLAKLVYNIGWSTNA